MARSTNDTVIGVVMLVLGILLLLGPLSLGPLVWIAAVAAVIIGIVILVQKGRNSMAMGIALIVIGILVLAFDRLAANIAGTLNLVVGVLLVIGGILKLMGKW
jgi:hypothetical protein